MSTAFLPVSIRMLSTVIFKRDPTFPLDPRGFFVCSFLLCSIYSDGSVLNPRGGGLLQLYSDISKFIDQHQRPGLWLEASSLLGFHISLLHSCFCLHRTGSRFSNFFVINASFIYLGEEALFSHQNSFVFPSTRPSPMNPAGHRDAVYI